MKGIVALAIVLSAFPFSVTGQDFYGYGTPSCPTGNCPNMQRAVPAPAKPAQEAVREVPFFETNEIAAYVPRTVVLIQNCKKGTQENVALGSGILVGAKLDKDNPKRAVGLVLTSDHLFWEVPVGDVYVTHRDGYRVAARVIDRDKESDIAAMLVWVNSDAPIAALADADPEAKGDVQLATIGYAGGTYRARLRKLEGYQQDPTNPARQVLCTLGEQQMGESGGGVFNNYGELVGQIEKTDGDRGGHTCCFVIRRYLNRLSQQQCTWANNAAFMRPSGLCAPRGYRLIAPSANQQTQTQPPIKPDTPTITPPTPCKHEEILAKLDELQKLLVAIQGGQSNTAVQTQLTAILEALKKYQQLNLTVEAPTFIEPTYVDVSTIWALQKNRNVEHAVLVVDSRTDSWTQLKQAYTDAKAKFPPIVLVDVASKNVAVTPLPQLVVYPKDLKTAPTICKTMEEILKKLQELRGS